MAVREFVKNGKEWIRDTQSAALNAFEGTPIADSFFSEPKVGVSVKRLIRALTKYTGLAETHAAELAPFGVDAAFLASGREILTGVQRGREAQGKASAAMPSSAAELQFVKGKAYLLIKQLSRAAHRVLNAERAKAYTPTRLFRTPKKSSASPTETPSTTPTSNS